MPPRAAAVGRQPPNAQQTQGAPTAVGPRPGRRDVILGDEVYLWIVVALELVAITWARSAFSRYHGG